MTRKS